MSYSKIKSFSFSKDFKTVSVSSASNNVQPLTYYKQVLDQCDDEKLKDESVFKWVKYWVKGFIDGGLQFNSQKHYINFIIEKTMQENDISSIRELWASEYDYNGKYNYELHIWNFPDDGSKEKYNQAVLKRETIENEMTSNIINNTYKKLYKNLKKEKFYLTNGYNFITSSGKRSFKYSGKESQNIKQFNGLDKIAMSNYFAIKNYGYSFQEVDA